MRIRTFSVGLCLALLILQGGCGKSSDADNLPPMEVEGVKVDTPRLMAEFVEAAPELQKPVHDAVNKIRYKSYLQAMMDLDAALKNPGLTDKQKNLITQVITQLKEVLAKSPPQPNR